MSTDPRLFVDLAIAKGAAISLEPRHAHYLGTVLRRGPGSRLRIFNGRDGEWDATLVEIRRDRAQMVVGQQVRVQAPEADLWLGFALLKRDATDLVMQKATELGASAILPVITARTNAARVNESRLASIAIEAAEQSERLTIPRVYSPQPLSGLLAAWPADRTLFAAIERSPALRPLYPAEGRAGLLIGPEGGFAPEELDALQNHPLVTCVQLGSLVLRAETACLAGLALLQAPGSG